MTSTRNIRPAIGRGLVTFKRLLFASLASSLVLIPAARAATTTTVAASGTTVLNLQTDTSVSGMKADKTGATFDWGFMTEGATVNYSLSVAKAGSYAIVLKYSSPTGGTGVNLYQNGTHLATVSFGNTGSYSTYTTISTPVSLTAGTTTFQIEAGYSGFNLAGVSFVGANTTPTPTPTPKPSPTPTPTNGRNYIMGVFQDSTDTATESKLGFKFDYTINNSYEDNCAGCGVSGLSSLGGYPVIVDVHHIMPSNPDFNTAASGGYNSYYESAAKSIAQYSSTVYAVRIDSEFNGAWSVDSPWQNNYNYNNGVSPATWIAGWRNFATAIRKYLPNAKIIWNPNTGQADPRSYYPGDDLVDLVGIDIYTFYQYYPNSTAATSDQMSGGWGNVTAISAFAKQHNKPIGFPEWGDTFGDGVFVTAMGAFINTPSNNVMFHAYWDSNQAVTGSSRFSDHPANQAAYVKAFGGKKYTGTYWSFKTVP